MIAALLLASAACLPPAPAPLLENPAPLAAGLEFLYDPERVYQIEQVAGGALCNQFHTVPGSPNFGNTDSGVWLRFQQLALGEPISQWRLLLRSGTLDRACVYWPMPGNTFRSDCVTPENSAGAVVQLNSGYLFAVPPDIELSRPVHISGHSPLWLNLPLEFGTADAFIRHERGRQTAWGLYFGFFAAVVVLGFTLALAQRHRGFLYGSAQLGALGLALCVWEGYWIPAGFNGTELGLTLIGLFIACGALFQQDFLDTRSHTPRLHRALSLCAGAALALIPLPLLVPSFGALLLGILLSVWMLTAGTAAVVRHRQGLQRSVFILLGLLVLLPGLYLNAIEFLGRPLASAEAARLVAAGGFLLAAGLLIVAVRVRIREAEQEQERQRDADRELERKNAEALSKFNQQMAQHQTQFDPLTRLPTRGKFREELHEQVKSAEETNRRFALVTLGLDNFSAINFALGYKSGDSVLVEITQRLQESVPAGDRLGRIGSDVFTWITEVGAAEPGLTALLERCSALQKILAAPLELGGGVKLNASVGVALYPDHGQTTEYLLRCSDAALHQAKNRGDAAIAVFESALYQKASNYLELKKEFYQTFEQSQLHLYYQPIVAVLDGRLSGVEALARWPRADGQFVPPDQFIPIAEAGDLVAPFTKWAVQTAVRQMADWHARGIPLSYVSINGSAAQLRIPEFANYFEQALYETGLPGETLAVEVTESNMLENMDATVKTLERLRALGIRIAVDDFGVGHSSLSYLRNLPLDTLKIDRAFLRGIPRDVESRTMLEGIITLAKTLRLPIVAEGVETQPQFDFLAKHGVKSAQGFLFSRALPAQELEAWLTQRPSPSRVVSMVA